MATPVVPAARRRFPSSAFVPPLLAWALFCAALGGGVAAYLHRASAATTEATYTRAESIAAVAEHTLLRTFEAVQGIHDLLQLRQALLEADEAPGAHAIQTHLKRVVEGGRFGVIQVGATDRAGSGAWGTGAAVPGAVSVIDRGYVRAHLEKGATGAVFVSEPILGRTTGRWGVQVSRPVRDLWGQTVGVGVVSLDPVDLSAGLRRHLNGAAQRAVVRRLPDGAVLARTHDMEAWLDRPGDPDHPAVAAARLAPSGRLSYRDPADGRDVAGVYRVPEGLPLVVISAFDVDAERAQFRKVAAAVAATAAAAMALGLQLALSWARGRDLRRRLQSEAERDPLTGLLNRRALHAQAPRLLAEARAGGQEAALLLLDLDHFKAINDAHGHDAGDRVLRDVAAVLAREIRRDDLACRWGGEELLALLRNCDLRRAEERAARLRAAIAAAQPGGVPGLRVTASIGVAAFPEHGAAVDDLVKRADKALYLAKRYGRDRVVCALAAA